MGGGAGAEREGDTILKGTLHPGPRLELGAGKGPNNTFSSGKVWVPSPQAIGKMIMLTRDFKLIVSILLGSISAQL